MRTAFAALPAALLVVLAAAFAPAAPPTEGTWTLTSGGRGDGRMQLDLRWQENSNWGRGIDRADLHGVTDAQIASPTSVPVAFRIEREAGTFDMQGFFHEGHGAGDYRFRPNTQFASTLRSLHVAGTEAMDDRDLMQLALSDMSSARVRGLMSVGLTNLTVKDLVKAGIFEVTPEYVRQMRALGVGGADDIDGVVEMRIHRITPEYVHELETLGYRGLDRRQLLEMGIHGVGADEVREMRALGFRDLSPRDLVNLRIHQVTPEYVRGMRAVGFGDATAEGFVEMRIHRITPELVHELAGLGYRNLPRETLLAMGIHGVTPDFIRQMRAAGFHDLSPETLVKMKIFGIDSQYVRATATVQQ